jgi:hypothetical protein
MASSTAGWTQPTWTQPVCIDCFKQWNRGRKPVQIKADMRRTETCCYCGKVNEDGVYIRVDPNSVKFPTEEEIPRS